MRLGVVCIAAAPPSRRLGHLVGVWSDEELAGSSKIVSMRRELANIIIKKLPIPVTIGIKEFLVACLR